QRFARPRVTPSVGVEEVDSAEAVHLEVDEAGRGEAASIRREDSVGGDDPVLDLDVAGDEAAVDERRADSEPHDPGSTARRTTPPASARPAPPPARPGPSHTRTYPPL